VGQIASVTTVSGAGRITMTGRIEQKGRSAHLDVIVSTAGAHYPIEGVLIAEHGDFVMYFRSPVFQSQLPAGKKWLRIDLQREGAKLGLDFSSLLGSPTAQSSRIVELGLVGTTRVGGETVAGRSTAHYRAVVDYDRAANRDARLKPTISKLEQLAGVRSLRITQDVWIGSDGRVRQLRYTTPSKTNGVRTSTTQTYTFLAYDVPVRISTPPASLVASVP
jgi:hypothetical protein